MKTLAVEIEEFEKIEGRNEEESRAKSGGEIFLNLR